MAAESKHTVEVEAHGCFVLKQEVRRVVNCSGRRDWSRLLEEMCAEKEVFNESYTKFKHDTRMTQKLAAEIIEYCRPGVEIRYTFGD